MKKEFEGKVNVCRKEDVRENRDPEKIEVSKDWLKNLVRLVDNLALEKQAKAKHGWLSHLIGYVHSLDEYLK